jgi:hypothetical protein
MLQVLADRGDALVVQPVEPAVPSARSAPETIWAILTDAPGYQAWDSGVERVEGAIAPGRKIKVASRANPGRAFPVKVTEFSPGQRITWSGGMPLGLFKGVRTFTLAPGTDGGIRFSVREEYTGPLLPLIWGAPCPTSAPRSASSPTA